MKVSTFAVMAFAAVASAAPIRILVVTGTGVKPSFDAQAQAFGAIRFGHAAASSSNPPMHLLPPISLSFPTHPSPRPPMHAAEGMGCAHRAGAKALALSNRLRQAFGMPPIAMAVHSTHPHSEGTVNILPFPYPGDQMWVHPTAPHGQPFIHRLHRAVNQLGLWEGRAVAFVLGCGLGVLLRMFFVLTILIVRCIRGYPNRQIQLPEEEPETTYVILPPSYNVQVIDEKSGLVLAAEPAPEYVEEVKEVQAS